MNKILLNLFCSLALLYIPLQSADWYVRPAGGNYGAENGTSYDNAWDGLNNVVWGPNGVKAGDTLWVCGLHVRNHTGGGTTQGWIIIGVSGASDTSRVTIRGDYPNDKGEVWGACRLSHESWVNEGNNTWSIRNIGGGTGTWLFEDVASSGRFTVLTKVNSLSACQSTAGSYYCSDYGSTTSRFYVHCTDNGNPTGRIYYESFGYRLVCAGKSYITFQNIDFYGNSFFFNAFDNEYVTYIKWLGCRYWHGTWYFGNGSHDIEIRDCDIAWGTGSGIAILGYMTPGPRTLYNYTISGNKIHDIGVHVTDVDAHGISSQGIGQASQ